jgi:hypothetical protein
MGTVFLVDAHTAVLLNSEINDTIPLESGNTQTLNGNFVVNVPFGVPIDGIPSNLTDLLTKKFAGMLAYYAGYTYIDYDDGIDATGWDSSNSTGVSLGNRGTTSIANGGTLQSSALALSGAAPSAAIVTWEAFEVTGFLTDNPKNGIKLRKYEEKDASDLTASVSFNGGSTWITPVTDGVQFSISPADQGTSFLIKLANSSGGRLWVGSWAVIY